MSDPLEGVAAPEVRRQLDTDRPPDGAFVAHEFLRRTFSQKLCAYFTVETVDSGHTNASGVTEDYWTSANSGIITYGYGVKVKIGSTTYDTNALGCVDFTSPNSSYVADVVVYTYATDVNGNYVRIHNGPSTSTASFPGTTYSILHASQSFSSGTTKVINVGGYQSRWTAMATLAYSLANYNNGMSNAEFHVSDLGGQNPAVIENCGGNFNYFNDVVNNESYISLVSINPTYCPDGHNQKNKFVVSHEYGHGYGFQISELATQSPASVTHSATPKGTCSFSMDDTDPDAFPYDNNTKEWSSLAMREGFAHFVSARLWNNAGTSAPNTEGQLRWGGSIDVERWAAGAGEGGHLVNECCPSSTSSCATSLNGAGVLTDWMRAFWDIHTDSTCAISKTNMPLLYSATINQTGLTNQNFFPKSQDAAAVVGCASRWTAQGCYNGIDRQGAIWAGC